MLTLENTAKAQRMRILAYLHTKPLDTLAARKELNVMHPAARVMELRKRGIGINTIWIDRESDCGKIHRIACYVLDGVAVTTPTDTEDGINSKETDKQEDSTGVVTVTTQTDISRSGNVSKNTLKPALNLETVEKLSTGKGKISSAILPVIKPGNVTALSIFQGAALHFDNANKSSSVAHLRGAQ